MENLIEALYEHPVVRKLADQFTETPYSLYLVGGAVRDAVAGYSDGFDDLDFTTDATPDQIEAIVKDLGPLWLAGKRFGTIGVFVSGEKLEVTTFRGETYEENSRKPNVTFSKDLLEDLIRRDFTVNAMAIRVDADAPEFFDPFRGAHDLKDKVLNTPGPSARTILEDPLRAVRAVRFAATRGFTLSVTVKDAIHLHGHRLSIVASERVMEECRKIFSLGADSVRRAFLLSRELGIRWAMFGELTLYHLNHLATLEVLGSDGYTALALMVAESADDATEIDAYLSPLMLPSGEKEGIKKIVECAMQLQDIYYILRMRALRREVGADTFERGAMVRNIAFGATDEQRVDIANVILDKRLEAPLPIDGEDVMAILKCRPGPQVGSALKFLEGLFCVDPDMTRHDLIKALRPNQGEL